MARKKPEAIEALERVSQFDVERWLQGALAEHTAKAKAALEEKGLARRPDETVNEWRKRTLAYVREQFAGINKA